MFFGLQHLLSDSKESKYPSMKACCRKGYKTAIRSNCQHTQTQFLPKDLGGVGELRTCLCFRHAVPAVTRFIKFV